MLKKLFTETCPNCESAMTGGHPNPEKIQWCVVCSSPRTGEIRGWVWRWSWFHRTFVVNPNFAFHTRLTKVLSAHITRR